MNYLVQRLSLTPYAKRPAGTYSGGNKRKVPSFLRVCVSLL